MAEMVEFGTGFAMGTGTTNDTADCTTAGRGLAPLNALLNALMMALPQGGDRHH